VEAATWKVTFPAAGRPVTTALVAEPLTVTGQPEEGSTV
jgi:hypothetical protein